jgi:4-alpha-glucanotransferase
MNMREVFADSERWIGNSTTRMRLILRVRYHSRFGQSLWLTGNHPLPGGGELEKAVPLEYLNGEFWQTSIALPPDALDIPISYDYILRNADGSQVADWGRDRVLIPSEFTQDELLVIDSWNDPGTIENVFATEPFKKVLLAANFTAVYGPDPVHPTHTLRIKAPLLAKGQTLCLLGEGKVLGNWNAKSPILLSQSRDQNHLSIKLDLRGQPFPIAYKYGIFDTEKNNFVRYEDGVNRVLHDSAPPNRHTLVNDGFVRLPADTWKGAGVAIPVFSLRSEKSFGVGEFEDLKLLADWAGEVGLKLIQILPVNDTTATHTWTDSYPYAAISVFALHPLYLNLAGVANAQNKKRLATLEPERRRLNALATVDYEAVMKAKLGFLRQVFPSQKAATFRNPDYRKFFADNRHWLEPYAVFSYLRDKYETPDFNQWPAHRRYIPDEIAGLAAGVGEATDEPSRKSEATARKNARPTKSAAHDDIALHYFIQFHLHRQLKAAVEHARDRGVILKGDIPIGVYRHGADVWCEPALFHADTQAGAPPDAFAARGQNWGFPTYNWTRMREDGFAWWKRRFEQMSCYFDAFRIDHILGFFRIWSIPVDAVEGIMGYFVPAVPLEAGEFAARGIEFDRKRLTRPFITDAVLAAIFGTDSRIVHRDFLDTNPSGIYALKPEFAAQRQVESHFASLEQNERNGKIKIGLFDLISNVILFEVDGKLHFRFGMEQTTSFKYLPPETQVKLKELYIDYFFRRQDDFWRREAMQKLPALKRVTRMLVCGEDLGFVPACVPGVMKQLGLLSLEVQRMPKELNREFSRPADAPYLSVVTPSSHDMSTIRGWWEEDGKITQKFYNQELHLPGAAPAEAAPKIVQTVVMQHLASPAMWSIFQLQDLMGMDRNLRRRDIAAERINVPANPRNYWRYRMHLTLERLQKMESFNKELRRLIEQSER